MGVSNDLHLRLVGRDKATHLSAHDARHRVPEEVHTAEDMLGGHVKPRRLFRYLHLIPTGLLSPRIRSTAVRDATAKFPFLVLEAAEPRTEFGIGIAPWRRSSPDIEAREQQRESRSDKIAWAWSRPDIFHG